MESLQRIPMSWEDYLLTPEHPRHEWVDGVVVVAPNAGLDHQHYSRLLANLLTAALPGLFVVEAPNVKLPRNRVRIPDVVALPVRERGTFVEGVPVLVVEILSPSTRTEDTMRKSGEYAEAGISQYWLLDPEVGRLDVLANVDGSWHQHALLDAAEPAGEVTVPGHGTVGIDLRTLLD
jgi:Uma2 family endonuclease